MENCYNALRHGGKFGVDVFDFFWKGKNYSLTKDWCNIAKEIGLTYIDSYPIVSRARKAKTTDTNTEKVHIFVKE